MSEHRSPGPCPLIGLEPAVVVRQYDLPTPDVARALANYLAAYGHARGVIVSLTFDGRHLSAVFTATPRRLERFTAELDLTTLGA